jgi:ATP-dependent protease ClpP protease subunit
MSAEEAKAYGLIDTIVESRGALVEETHQPSVTA